MKISLIGMAGVGKSKWAAELEERGFMRYCCDDLIEQKLSKELKKLGYKGINDVSRWMGQPYDRKYKENSQKYLELETKAIEDILSDIKKLDKKDNVVIDTTGSLIYLSASLLNKLRQNTTIVYLEAPVNETTKMIRGYFSDPKPVIWGYKFKPRPGEKNIAALERCYADLLAFREKKYRELAEITINYNRQNDLLKQINQYEKKKNFGHSRSSR